jgi:mRNA interferase MazF
MGKFVKGDIVVIPFPFSDLSGSKRRPALVLADLDGDDVILCQITSVARNDNYAVPIDAADFESGTLPVKSFVRPRLFERWCRFNG